MEKGRRCLAVIRVRGVSDVWSEVEDTLKMLNLTRNCHATLVDDRPSYLGMLRKAQNYITWGEVSKEAILLLLKKRGRLIGGKRIDEEYAERLGYRTLDELAEAIYNLKVNFKELPDVKPVFRLHPPKGGYKGKIKRSYRVGGVTGYRGEAINDLIRRMA